MSALQPDAETVMAVRQATGLAVMEAKELIQTSPELAQRVLDGHKVRFITRLAKLPVELREKILEASDSQRDEHFLCDPIESDPVVGATIRETLERVGCELETARGRYQMGLCHSIWRTAQSELLQKHGIVWYTPAQMNPGACFD
ncbi:hypothetical protein [Brevifollis gellanilyticus]|uniref:Uncharacterized protein n=1 Tax=Brevifollis gellanilyticus TaxID=748831 RepID=A0A512MEQ8_9BACT|nr:hypothetical protein [Brevifollis gellanilyticus]GEP45196.1 hypothetical protein BGE01nite_44870 [Brevifollis gellanilyticus]